MWTSQSDITCWFLATSVDPASTDHGTDMLQLAYHDDNGSSHMQTYYAKLCAVTFKMEFGC